MADAWLDESLYADWGQRFRIKRELARVTSAFQDIVLFESFSHGRVLVLDGAVQLTEADEFVYSEMLAHVPLLAHGAARRVLIIGAGDGGVLRRVLQHRGVERAVLAEIDGEVVRLAREHMPGVGGPAWTDERAEIVIGDGIDYLRHAADGAFDAIIVDSTDPVGAAAPLFSDAFYADCARVLARRGVLVNQCGVPFMQGEELRDNSQCRARHFRYVTAYAAAVPTYVGGLMTLGFASQASGLDGLSAETIRARAEAAGILGLAGYWTPEIHVGAFNLPPYVLRCLPNTE